MLEEIAALPVDERMERILRVVADETRAVLRLSNGYLDADRGFFEMGMDSLMSVELKGRLEKRFGARLPATLTFNHPTISAVAGYLAERSEAIAAALASAERDADQTDAGLSAADAEATDAGATDMSASAPAPTDGNLPGEATATGDEDGEAKLTGLLEERLARLGLEEG